MARRTSRTVDARGIRARVHVVDTTRFGSIRVPEDRIITLPMGLPGFVDATTFILLDDRPGAPYRWLQSLERPELAFVVIDPLAWRPDFPLDAVRRSASFAGIDPDEELVVLAICTLPAPPAEPTANFLAPIGIGAHSRRGAQVALYWCGLGAAERFLDAP